MRYRGAGMVSANNSSRLLMDYKWEHPESYRKILELIFGSDGLAVSHLKIEMGSDINSSSGTEPSVKRAAFEKADVRRGAGFMLAKDAKEINPDLTLDMLWWSEPRWVSNADNVYEMRYAWYKESLDEAYSVHGLVFDYVSAVQNERAVDGEWIKYLSRRLKAEKNCPYDYSKIKIVAGDEVCTWITADMMLADPELLDAVDVIGSHYTSHSSDNAKKLAKAYGKEMWFSEASTPMRYVPGAARFDADHSGLGGLNGVLDVANRFITMYAEGLMTLCEYQPIVAAYYDGVNYSHKQFIEAADPWSGYFRLDAGFFMQLHFSRFIKKGWCFVDGANYGDGKVGGDGHALVDATYSYMTVADPETGDYTVVITNTTPEPVKYSFAVCGNLKAVAEPDIWETYGCCSGAYNVDFLKKKGSIRPEAGCFEYVVAPSTIVTLTTLKIPEKAYVCPREIDREVLSLPYYDDFSYVDYPEDYLLLRGIAPKFMTDQGGAFEVVKGESGNMLIQKILPETKANEWGGTPEPTTNFGDDRWYNYSLSADITLAEEKTAGEGEPDKGLNYAGIGIRYFLAADDKSGYSFLIYTDGKWVLEKNGTGFAEGKYSGFCAGRKVRLKLAAVYAKVAAYIDGISVFDSGSEFFYEKAFPGAGRAALYSAYAKNCFENLAVEPVPGADAFAKRLDDTDDCFEYEGEWEHELMSSFRNYKRTLSSGMAGSSFSVRFTGSGIALGGENAEAGDLAVIRVELDGKVCETAYAVPVSGRRELFYATYGLDEAEHVLKVTILTGRLNLDYVLI
ncbi:MAG: glycosyl hydrolase family 59 [Lachnospiraceae bacterium]|nr:glycosyl hydrolase family 59 [Lachnospiraceae bacterium]